MYRIFLDGKLIHDINIKNLQIYEPVATLEQNGIDAFTFTIYPTNQYYNQLYNMKSIITVYQRDFLIFRGRVLEMEANIKQAKTVYCEGEIAFMCDTIQMPYEWHGDVIGLFRKVIEEHNSQVDESKQFKVGIVTVTDPNDYIMRSDSTYMTTWEAIKEKFLEKLGGYIRIRHEDDGNYIDYLEDFDTLNAQEVVFGENMLTIKHVNDSTEICTVLIPFGATIDDTEEKLTIESVNGGKIYVEHEENIKKYGRITKTAEWEDVTQADNLKRKALEMLNEVGKEISTIEISALDMANINKDIRNFRMYSKIKVISVFHGIDDYFVPQKMTISLFNQKNNTITLSGTIATITGGQSGNKIDIDGIIKEVNKIDNNINLNIPLKLSELKKELASEISQSVDGIYSEVSERYYSKADTDEIISDVSTSLEQAKNYFEMNFNSFTQDFTDLLSSTNATFEDIRKYIRFEDGNIILGQVGNEFKLKITKERISFLQGIQEVAYISNSRLYNTFVEVMHTLRIGNFAFIPRANGNLTFKKWG